MNETQPAEPDPPRTLAEAHQVLAGVRPPRKAPLSEWLTYYQRSAAVYAEVAEIDRGHHHEALFMAERERQHAKEIKTQISSQRPNGEASGE
ncbi:MAG: AMED_5909 family protein [Pseudonocardiaceae bacterium]